MAGSRRKRYPMLEKILLCLQVTVLKKVSKILTVILVKVMLVQTGSLNLKRPHKVSLQPSHVIITISGSAAKRQTMRQVIYSGDIFVRNVYKRAMLSEVVCGKRF
jgi:hypothetical protein